MRTILDSGRHRWAAEVVVLAAICRSAGDSDVRRIQTLPLGTTLSIVALGLILTAIGWVLLVYLFSWAATLVGRHLLAGEATTADVRAAVAWGLVPLIWTGVLIRIPARLYLSRFMAIRSDEWQTIVSFIESGGCGLAVVLIAVQFTVFAWAAWVTSSCVGEALRFSTARGFGTLAITAVIPLVVTIAGVIASHG